MTKSSVGATIQNKVNLQEDDRLRRECNMVLFDVEELFSEEPEVRCDYDTEVITRMVSNLVMGREWVVHSAAGGVKESTTTYCRPRVPS